MSRVEQQYTFFSSNTETGHTATLPVRARLKLDKDCKLLSSPGPTDHHGNQISSPTENSVAN